MNGKFIIYGLVDPRTSMLRYIGLSSYGLRRPRAHSNVKKLLSRPTPKNNWIRKLLSQGLNYEIVVIQEVMDKEILSQAEIFWIDYFKDMGFKLLNLTKGGEGTFGFKPWNYGKSMSTEPRIKSHHNPWKDTKGVAPPMSKENKLRVSKLFSAPKSEAHKQKLSKALLGRKLSVAIIEKTASKLRGRKKKPLSCPVCGKTGNGEAMYRWHFDKCKKLGVVK